MKPPVSNRGFREPLRRLSSRLITKSLTSPCISFLWTIYLTLQLILLIQCDKYPLLDVIPESNFSCRSRTSGYYADDGSEARCQVYHMCNPSGRRYSYLCPNHTLFNQDKLICDHWYRVNCTDIERRSKINDQLFANDLNGKWPRKVVFTNAGKDLRSTSNKTSDKRTNDDKSRTGSSILQKRCSGCLEHFMRDKITCKPCVLPR